MLSMICEIVKRKGGLIVIVPNVHAGIPQLKMGYITFGIVLDKSFSDSHW
jgi:hypothetical protein